LLPKNNMPNQTDIITQLFSKQASKSNLPPNRYNPESKDSGSGIILIAIGAIALFFLMRKK